MPTIRVPEAHRDAVLAVSRLSGTQIQELSDAIDAARSDLPATRSALAPFVEPPAPLLEALIGMASTCQAHDLAPTVVADGVRADLGEEAGDAPFEVLLANSSIRRLARRSDVGYSHEHVLVQFRVFTEMRPVFDDEISDGFKAAVVTHSVKIAHQTSDGIEEFYVTVDDADLVLIQEQVSRAITKSRKLTDFLVDNDVTPLTDPEHWQ